MKDALVIVAHPDDETIWMGGTILQSPKINWTIISLCRKDDSDRAPKFERVCRVLNAKAIISDLDDELLKPLPLEQVAQKIKSLLPKTNYDFIYTHGQNGEYGHIRHKEVHKAVKQLIQSKQLNSKKLFFFAYSPTNESPPSNAELKLAKPDKHASERVHVRGDNFKKKKTLVRETYGFGGDSFEVVSCTNVETFNLF